MTTRIKKQIIEKYLENSWSPTNELNLHLHQTLHSDTFVHIEYYKDGWLENITVKIKNIDMTQMFLEGYLLKTSNTIKLSLFDITKITIDN